MTVAAIARGADVGRRPANTAQWALARALSTPAGQHGRWWKLPLERLDLGEPMRHLTIHLVLVIPVIGER